MQPSEKPAIIQPREEAITINPTKAALLLLHWQNDIATAGGKIAGSMPERLKAAHIIENAQAVLKATRAKGMLVIYVNAGHRPGYPEISARPAPIMANLTRSGALIRGTWGAEVIDELKPLENEVVIYNYSTSGFSFTELDLILRSKGITDLVLSGLVTNFIIESTAMDAANRGYLVYTLSDCCNCFTDEMHKWSLTNILPAFGPVLVSKKYIAALESK